MNRFDYAIVGAGMAGASLAAELAPHASVLLLEAEDQAGYHATGRSAAFWEECYGGPQIVPLTKASGQFLREHGLLNGRGALYVGRAQDKAKLDEFEARFRPTGATFARINAADLQSRVPGVREDWCDAIWQPACADIDVSRLHMHYLSLAQKGGAHLETHARLASAEHAATGWSLQTENNRSFTATRLVNAAGAWADQIAQLAGCREIGITPLRRTVAQVRVYPTPLPKLPLVLDISGQFYFKPEHGKIWLSPHDEEPSAPCDAAPEEIAIAQAIDRFEQVVNWKVDRVETKWAGLRSFAPDRLPIYGPDPNNPDFIWFAGQGGFGIQTAPAAAALMASVLLNRSASMDVSTIDISKFSPTRFG